MTDRIGCANPCDDIERLKADMLELVEACFSTVDPEDAEEIMQLTWPKGAPEFVLQWYREHPSEGEATP